MDLTWEQFKQLCEVKDFSVQFFDSGESYIVCAFDGHLKFNCVVLKGTPEATEFEADMMPTANGKIAPIKDEDGAQIVNPKLAGGGRRYVSTFISFSTADLDSFHSKGWDQSNLGIATLKLFDVNGVEITDNANKANAVETVLTLNQTKDFDIQGFCIYQREQPNQDVFVYAAIAPHIPKAFGGTVEAIQGCNLRYGNFGNRKWIGWVTAHPPSSSIRSISAT